LCTLTLPLQLLERPEQFSADMLLRARRRFGISEVVAGKPACEVYTVPLP
jgi:hypothetical protein